MKLPRLLIVIVVLLGVLFLVIQSIRQGDHILYPIFFSTIGIGYLITAINAEKNERKQKEDEESDLKE